MSNNLFALTFEQFKIIYEAIEGEPEFSIYFGNRDEEYMIIKYAERVSFQRCGVYNGSGEIFFDTLDSLFISNTIDEICLKEDWKNITDIIVNYTYQLSIKDDLIDLCADYNFRL